MRANILPYFIYVYSFCIRIKVDRKNEFFYLKNCKGLCKYTAETSPEKLNKLENRAELNFFTISVVQVLFILYNKHTLRPSHFQNRGILKR